MTTDRAAIFELATHQVENQPPLLADYNSFQADRPLREAVNRDEAVWAEAELNQFGQIAGSVEYRLLGEQANRFPPELKAFDRYGHRIDLVEYHPAYHQLFQWAVSAGVHSVGWTAPTGGHQVHAALLYLLSQVEAGVCCPVSMTYAGIAALRKERELAEIWESGLLSREYDPRFIPHTAKRGLTCGMAMTEKQGGSDVRSNTTRALGTREAGVYELFGHKWFCSAPMSDAFLVLAKAKGGLSCFLVPRWRPDGSRNPFFIQRLKDKLGNRSNASSEVEFQATWARLIGSEGEGVQNIIAMVHHTRLDAAVAAASFMRQAFVQAAHHTSHRRAFGKRLMEHLLMRNVLAELALESEAATQLVMRVARSFDHQEDEAESAFARLATAVAKYWLNRRAPHFVFEALECLGGAGFVEESTMPRLYREAPLNSIWEGSGNVICLDVLRTIRKQPESLEAYIAEVGPSSTETLLKDRLENIKRTASRPSADREARLLVEQMACLLQASLLRRFAPAFIADAFVDRLGDPQGWAFGTLSSKQPLARIIRRGWHQ